MPTRRVKRKDRGSSETDLLQRVAEYVRKYGRTHYSIIALHINRSPSWVVQRARIIESLFDDIVYDYGYFDIKTGRGDVSD